MRPKIGYTDGFGFLFATITGTKCANQIATGWTASSSNPTANRKVIATSVTGQADDNEGRHVATLMQHSFKTANE